MLAKERKNWALGITGVLLFILAAYESLTSASIVGGEMVVNKLQYYSAFVLLIAGAALIVLANVRQYSDYLKRLVHLTTKHRYDAIWDPYK